MAIGVDGTLLGSQFVADLDRCGAAAAVLDEGRRHLTHVRRWWAAVGRQLGPTASRRQLMGVGAVPLARALGFTPTPLADAPPETVVALWHDRDLAATLIVAGWRQDAAAAFRDAAHRAVALVAPWALVYSGDTLSIVETRMPSWPRGLDVEWPVALDNERIAAVACGLCAARTLVGRRGSSSWLTTLVAESDRRAATVRASLRGGVLEAVTALMNGLGPQGRHADLGREFDDALTVVHRVLFLLFAEARGLVPMWHPVYRHHYTIDALRRACEEPGRARGLWDTLEAIARLAHAGCRAGDLRVTPFNGALFAPRRRRPPLRRRRDEAVRRSVLALTTTPTPDGRRRIDYRDLGVEQLGAIYESLLDYEPAHADDGRAVDLQRGSLQRKATGSFYTPRAITEHLVRATLDPLVAGRSSAAILALRIVDPAMGSGACLVAACRHLATALEAALVAEGALPAGDITEADRAMLRRQVALRCLYGVDLNPTAVQLARLSLWLTTLAADRPLGFLDHHLAVGNSLVGASIADLARRPSSGRMRRGTAQPPLFDFDRCESALASALPVRRDLELTPDDTVAVVRQKERRLAALVNDTDGLGRWRAALDTWCGAWFARRGRIDATVVSDLVSTTLGDASDLPPHLARPLADEVLRAAAAARAFHWTIAFPEVFFDDGGARRADAGFDAVIGNPPWDVVRADSGDASARSDARGDVRRFVRFVRDSGIYRYQSIGHPNRYRLFVERALQLVRPGGRIGLVLPGALLSDHASGDIRRALLERTAVDAVIGFDNRQGIFPIHRSVTFVLLTSTAGGRTDRLPLRLGLADVAELGEANPRVVVVERALLERVSGSTLDVPRLVSPRDVATLERVTAMAPRLDDPDGWGATFGREFNATDDRPRFLPLSPGTFPIVEGRQIQPFRVDLTASTLGVAAHVALRRLGRAATGSRVACRDVAGATNRLTLIAALLPAHAVSTHTVVCLKTPLPRRAGLVLVALLNSFVANHLVRLRVGTHVTTALLESLRVPFVRPETAAFERLHDLAQALTCAPAPERAPEYVDLQATVARLYRLTRDEFEHVLGTFPLVDVAVRNATLSAFTKAGAP